jgi:hypothetical protein
LWQLGGDDAHGAKGGKKEEGAAKQKQTQKQKQRVVRYGGGSANSDQVG